MGIGYAVQDVPAKSNTGVGLYGAASASNNVHSCIRVYDDAGMILFTCPTFLTDQLLGYTSSSVAILRQGRVYTFNERGMIRGVVTLKGSSAQTVPDSWSR